MDPVDELKQLAARIKSQIEYVQDQIGGDGDLESAQDVLDGIGIEMRAAVARHSSDPLNFEDGTPVKVTVQFGPGYVSDFYPRRDGDFDAWCVRLSADAEAHYAALLVHEAEEIANGRA